MKKKTHSKEHKHKRLVCAYMILLCKIIFNRRKNLAHWNRNASHNALAEIFSLLFLRRKTFRDRKWIFSLLFSVVANTENVMLFTFSLSFHLISRCSLCARNRNFLVCDFSTMWLFAYSKSQTFEIIIKHHVMEMLLWFICETTKRENNTINSSIFYFMYRCNGTASHTHARRHRHAKVESRIEFEQTEFRKVFELMRTKWIHRLTICSRWKQRIENAQYSLYFHFIFILSSLNAAFHSASSSSSLGSKSNKLKSNSCKYSSIFSCNKVFSMISVDISKFVIGEVALPPSNHSSSASFSYENPSEKFTNKLYLLSLKMFLSHLRP